MKKLLLCKLAVAAAVVWPFTARADTLIFDSYSGGGSTTNRPASFSPGSEITASADTDIDSIAVLMDINAGGAAANLEF